MTDETLRARLPLAALAGSTVAVWTALPEVVSGRWARLAARGALLTASSVAVILLDDDEPTPRPDRDEKMAVLSRAMDDPAQRAAILMIVLVGLSTAANLEDRLLESGAARLRRRGFALPRTALGLGLGALTAGTQLAPSKEPAALA